MDVGDGRRSFTKSHNGELENGLKCAKSDTTSAMVNGGTSIVSTSETHCSNGGCGDGDSVTMNFSRKLCNGVHEKCTTDETEALSRMVNGCGIKPFRDNQVLTSVTNDVGKASNGDISPSSEIGKSYLSPTLEYSGPRAVLELSLQSDAMQLEATSFRARPADLHEFYNGCDSAMDCELRLDYALSVTEAKEHAISRLQEELRKAQEELKLKDEEVARLSRIRDRVGSELEDLTASLFQEAHNMVREANVKRGAAEKSLTEANLKIEVLQAEVQALKTLVLTSTPSMPNRHLHPHLDPRSSVKRDGEEKNGIGGTSFLRGHKRSPSHCNLKYGREITPPGSPVKSPPEPPAQSSFCPEEYEYDPLYHKEFVSWRQDPIINHDHPFLERVYREDIIPCLNFTNTELSTKVRASIEDNSITIESVSGKSPFPKRCALLDAPRLCRYRMKIGDSDQWHYISQLCRDRVAAVCDFLCYLRYIQQGLVKSSVNDVYWEMIRLRKQISLARLGVH